jgi:outer membrane protein assembly factor BamB
MAGTHAQVEGTHRRSVLAAALLVAAAVSLAVFLAVPGGRVLAASADWPAYNHDAARTGVSSDQDALGTIQPAWTSASLDGRSIYAQPLVVGDRVIVATEGDSLFSLDAATGGVVWSRNLGTPVPKSDLPGGNIDPSGITGTPVVDTSSGTIYAVAFIRDGGAHHELFAVDLSTGTVDWHRTVDPPGLSPLVEQERGAVALSGGRVYVAYGGLYGDIGQYKGAVVSSAADGTGAVTSYILPTTRRGGMWNPAGPVVDGSGDLWVVTGNTISQSAFDYGNSLIRLSPALSVLDYFAPTNWASLNAADLDLCTLAPVLMPSGRVLAIGKAGTAYLLDTAALGHVTTAPVSAAIGGSPYGSAAISGSRVFVPCSASLKALDVSTTQIKVAWTISGASSSPIIAAGYVWSVGYAGLLKAVDPATGTVVYSQQLSTPPSRFTSPAAAGGRLFVPDGTKITALSLHDAPVVTSLTPPARAPAGGPVGTNHGTGFTNASAVTFGGTPATTFTVVSPSRITATAPAHALGKVDVAVTTAWGTSATAGTGDDFTYTDRYEQTDPRIVKTGSWSDFLKPAASGGSYGRSSTAGATATIYFTEIGRASCRERV